MRKSQRLEIINSISSVFKPHPKQTVVEWAEQQYSLTPDQSAIAGRYSTAITPYAVEIINSFSDFNFERLVLCFGTQVSKTQSFMAGLGWALVHEPCPIMWVMPNKNLAQNFSETRLQPFLFSSNDIKALIPKKRFSIKLTEMQFVNSLLTLVGSNSPANLASRPVRILFADEIDKFGEETSKEANALVLAAERTRSFAESKICLSSTPTTYEGQIWQEYLNGDQRRWFVPCPHCDKYIVLVLNPQKSAFTKSLDCEAKLCWSETAKRGDRWDYDAVARSTHFLCPHCKGEIQERYKTKMNALGKWVPTNSDYADSKIRSYHLPSFYAPWRKSGWGYLAVEFLKYKNSVEGLKGFINSVCAEPDMGQWDGSGTLRRELVINRETEELLTEHEGVVIMTVDVQKDHFWFAIREWFNNGDSILLKWGKVDTYDDLEDEKKINGVEYVGVDSGYDTTRVYSECAMRGWFAMRGDDKQSWTDKNKVQVPYIVKVFDPMIGTKKAKLYKIAQLTWSNPSIKDIVARMRDKESSPVKWGIVKEYATEEYFRHLDGEYKKAVVDKRTGRVVRRWVLRNSRWENHLFDCECMNAAAAMFLGILKRKEDEEK